MTLADLAIVAIMLLSGLLALMRGFTREVFSLISWVGAAFVTLWLYPPLQSTGRAVFGFIPQPWVDGLTAVIIFLIALIAFTYITTKLTEKVRGTAPGPFDGTAGFIFGLARGFLLVCVAYLLYGWLMQPREEPKWIAGSLFLPLIEQTNEASVALVSDNEDKIPVNPTAVPQKNEEARKESGYSSGARTEMDRILGNR